MWSEHCSYKHSKIHLALFPSAGEAVLQGRGKTPGVGHRQWTGAGIPPRITQPPFGNRTLSGAATGIGGIVRDILRWAPVRLLCWIPCGSALWMNPATVICVAVWCLESAVTAIVSVCRPWAGKYILILATAAIPGQCLVFGVGAQRPDRARPGHRGGESVLSLERAPVAMASTVPACWLRGVR